MRRTNWWACVAAGVLVAGLGGCTDDVCVTDCTAEADCTGYGMHCYLIDTNGGVCLAPCSSDAGCGSGTCNTTTGICQ